MSENPTAVITGGSSGFGEATALRLSRRGYSVVLGARREDKLKKVVAAIEAEGGTATYRVTDVTSREDVQKLVDHAVSTYGGVDVMINNAGIMPQSFLSAGRVDEWDQAIDINLKGVLYGIAAALPVMKKQGHGHVVNLSSIAGIETMPGGGVYCATKFGVRALSDVLRQEAAIEKSNVRVTTVMPGAYNTELVSSVKDEQSREGIEEFYAQVGVSPDHVAAAIEFAVTSPAESTQNEIVLRPTAQQM